jgi:hypothetical protein
MQEQSNPTFWVLSFLCPRVPLCRPCMDAHPWLAAWAGNLINFFGVSWGIISAIVPPSPAYQPQARAYESTFLNICEPLDSTGHDVMMTFERATGHG